MQQEMIMKDLDADLREAVRFYEDYIREADKGIIGLRDVKDINIFAVFAEIPTTGNQVNSGLTMMIGVPGTAKTNFGVTLAGITKTEFGRIQGRSDIGPGDIVGNEVWNFGTNQFESRAGPIVTANILLADEINRMPAKSQSAFLEGIQEKTVTIGRTKFNLPKFNYVMATANPPQFVEGTYPLTTALLDRFTFIVNVDYLPSDAEQKLVKYDFKAIDICQILTAERAIELRRCIADKIVIPDRVDKYIRRLVRATRPNETNREVRKNLAKLHNDLAELSESGKREMGWLRMRDLRNQTQTEIKRLESHVSSEDSPSELVREYVQLGAGPRATICWGRAAKPRAVFIRKSNTVFPEDILAIARNILEHRIHLVLKARRDHITVDDVIKDVLRSVPVP
jgi:MoxR-like ATPase